jgi:hypothetical protein
MNNTTYPSAELFRDLMTLAHPVTIEVNGETLVRADGGDNYTRLPEKNYELDALKAKSDVERATVSAGIELSKLKLSANKAQSYDGLTSLDSLCVVLKAEIAREAATPPIFVQVSEYNAVTVFGSYEADYTRKHLYNARSDNSDFNFSADILAPRLKNDVRQLTPEEAIIVLQTKYVPNDDVEYVVGLLSNVSDNTEVKNLDNGLTQQVTVNQGLSLKANETVKKRVALRPFRTFMEVEQPASDYLLRLHKSSGSGDVGVTLTPADGGAWILTAKANIAAYLRESLSALTEAGTVIVTV